MKTMALPLALALSLVAAADGLAQTTGRPQEGSPPDIAHPTRPQSDQTQPDTPAPAAKDLREYAGMLETSREQLRQALDRSGKEPDTGSQSNVSPAGMDLKAAAEDAFQTIQRAPANFRQDAAYEEASMKARQQLGPIMQSLRAGIDKNAVQGMLDTLEKLQREVSNRAG